MVEKNNSEKKCFVICPIGEEDSVVRKRSDLVLEYVIKLVTNDLGYVTSRSDEDNKPGTITSQIIQHLIDDELIIADLSFGNPNVYYELAVRHMVRKPVVQIIHLTDSIHFDIITQRTIRFDYQDLRSVEECKKKLKAQIISAVKNPEDVDSPISIAVDSQGLNKSNKPMDKLVNQLMMSVQNIQQQMNSMQRSNDIQWQQRNISNHPLLAQSEYEKIKRANLERQFVRKEEPPRSAGIPEGSVVDFIADADAEAAMKEEEERRRRR